MTLFFNKFAFSSFALHSNTYFCECQEIFMFFAKFRLIFFAGLYIMVHSGNK